MSTQNIGLILILHPANKRRLFLQFYWTCVVSSITLKQFWVLVNKFTRHILCSVFGYTDHPQSPIGFDAKLRKPPLHRAATFVPPLSDQKYDQDAQWLPKPWKFCICVTATARPLCLLEPPNWCSGTTGRAKEAEWRQNHCHGGTRAALVAE